MRTAYCLNNADHYGRMCEFCECCSRCCVCAGKSAQREARSRRLRARFAAAHASLDHAANALRDELEERGVSCRYVEALHGPKGPFWLLPRVSVTVSSSRARGAHVKVSAAWGRPDDYYRASDFTDLSAVADRIESYYAAGIRTYLERSTTKSPGAAELIAQMSAAASANAAADGGAVMSH